MGKAWGLQGFIPDPPSPSNFTPTGGTGLKESKSQPGLSLGQGLSLLSHPLREFPARGCVNPLLLGTGSGATRTQQNLRFARKFLFPSSIMDLPPPWDPPSYLVEVEWPFTRWDGVPGGLATSVNSMQISPCYFQPPDHNTLGKWTEVPSGGFCDGRKSAPPGQQPQPCPSRGCGRAGGWGDSDLAALSIVGGTQGVTALVLLGPRRQSCGLVQGGGETRSCVSCARSMRGVFAGETAA